MWSVSLVAISLILLLFFSELSIYLQTETVDHLLVDVSRGEKLRINFDITFPHIPCSLLSLDAMDVSGSHQLDVSHHIKKKPLDRFGEVIGAEVKHELSAQLSEADAKVYAAAKANGTAGATPITPLATPAPAPPRVDPTKQPGYCGAFAKHNRAFSRIDGCRLRTLAHFCLCLVLCRSLLWR